MADELQKASDEADARLAAEAARRQDAEGRTEELTMQLQAARAAKAAVDAEVCARFGGIAQHPMPTLSKCSLSVPGYCSCRTAQEASAQASSAGTSSPAPSLCRVKDIYVAPARSELCFCY